MNPQKKSPSKADALQSSRPPSPTGAKPGARPGAKTGSNTSGKLVKTPKKEGFKIPPVPVLVGIVFGLIVLIFGIIMIWPASTPTTVVVADEIQPKEADEFPVDEAPIYPPDYYLASPTPIQELGRQATEKALREHLSYTPGQGLLLPDGTLLPESSIELFALRDSAIASTTQQLQGMTQSQVDTTTGTTVILVRDNTTGQMTPIGVATQASAFEAQAYRFAAANIELQMAQMNARDNTAVLVAQSQQPVIEKQIIVENVLDDTEKRKYLNLVETQERENAKLRDKMANMQADMISQRSQVIDVIQRIEDSPTANQRLRASMLPKQTGLTQQAIVGDRVWFEDKDGKLTTHRIGDVIDGTSLIISGTDEANNIVLVTGK